MQTGGTTHRSPKPEDPALAYPPPRHESLRGVDDPTRTRKSLAEQALEGASRLSERARSSGWIRSAAAAVASFNRGVAHRIERWLQAGAED